MERQNVLMANASAFRVPAFNINNMEKSVKNLICLIVLMFLCFNVFMPAVGAESIIDNLVKFKTAANLPGSADINPIDIVIAVINTLLGLLGLIFVILLIYAGFTYMTAQGDDKKITKAKDTIRNAVIGVIIILFAYIITNAVFTLVLQAIKK